MKSRIAMVWFAALVGCAKSADDLPGIVPDAAASASSAGTGGYDATGAGGTDDAASTASVGAGGNNMGHGGGAHGSSGSRLRLLSYVGDDGSIFIKHEAFDSELGFSCQFLQAIDGTTRCFPMSIGFLYYADASCSVALATMAECSPLSERHITHLDSASTDRCPSRVHRAFSMSRDPVPFDSVYIKSGAECVMLQLSAPMLLHELTEVPPEALARAILAVETP